MSILLAFLSPSPVLLILHMIYLVRRFFGCYQDVAPAKKNRTDLKSCLASKVCVIEVCVHVRACVCIHALGLAGEGGVLVVN